MGRIPLLPGTCLRDGTGPCFLSFWSRNFRDIAITAIYINEVQGKMKQSLLMRQWIALSVGWHDT